MPACGGRGLLGLGWKCAEDIGFAYQGATTNIGVAKQRSTKKGIALDVAAAYGFQIAAVEDGIASFDISDVSFNYREFDAFFANFHVALQFRRAVALPMEEL